MKSTIQISSTLRTCNTGECGMWRCRRSPADAQSCALVGMSGATEGAAPSDLLSQFPEDVYYGKPSLG